MKRLVVIVFLVAACNTTRGPAATQPETTPALEPGVTYETDAPEPAPVDVETFTAKVGDVVRIVCDGVECLDVTVVKAKFASKYGSGYSTDTPAIKGHVFVAVYVKYRSLLSGSSYGLNEWQLYVNDEIVDQTYTLYGPKPDLSYGNLPKGKSTSGWMFWEVPKTGRVVVSYGASYNQAAVFEIVLRSK